MSLLYRQACQPILDQYGLENTHVDISQYRPWCLTIVGKCGQHFLEVSGIRFTRYRPTKAEIPITVELLDDFLLSNIDKIKAYLKAKKEADATPQPKQNKKYTPSHGGYILYYDDGPFKYSIFGGKDKKLGITAAKGITEARLRRYVFDVAKLKAARLAHKPWIDYYTKTKALEDARSTLNTCSSNF